MANTMNSTVERKFIEACHIIEIKIYEVVEIPDKRSIILYVFALFTNVCLIFTTLFFNGVTIATIWKSRKLREIKSNFLIIIQSMVDLANGIFFMTLSAVIFVFNLSGMKSCVILFLTRNIGTLLFTYSMVAMSMMNFERYFGVLYPFIHRAKVTKERLLKYFISVSSFETFLNLGGTFYIGEKMNKIIYTVNFLSFFVLTAFVHLRIFLVVIKKIRLPGPSCESDNTSKTKNMEKKTRFMKQIKVAKSCFLVVFTSYVCCLPGIIMFGCIDNSGIIFLIVTLRKFSSLLLMLNSTLNSLIFFWRNKVLRKEGLKFIRSSLNKQKIS